MDQNNNLEPTNLLFTDIRQANEQSSDFVKRILDDISDGFTALDRNWHVTYINKAAQVQISRIGINAANIGGRNVWEAIPGLHHTRMYAEYHRCMQEQVEIEFEEYYDTIDAWFEFRLFPSSSGIISYARDITVSKRINIALVEQQRALALSAQINKSLSTSDSLGEMLHGCTDAIVRCFDASFARIWTLENSSNDLVLQASSGLYTHLNGPHARVPLGNLKIGKIALSRQPHLTNVVVGDIEVGDQEWAIREGMIAFAGYPLLIENEVKGVVALFAKHTLSELALQSLEAVSQEIALGIARKQISVELASSQEWLATTLLSIGDCVIATDNSGIVKFLNPVAIRMTGWSAADAVGRPLSDVFNIVNEHSGLPVRSPVDIVIAKGETVGLANHTVLISKDGTRRPIDDSAAPIRSVSGEVEGIVLVFHDIADRRRAEKRAEAQHRVSEALAFSTNLEEASYLILEAIGESLGWSIGIFWIMNTNSQLLRVSQTWIASNRRNGPASTFNSATIDKAYRIGEGLPGKLLEANEPKWVERVDLDPSFLRHDAGIAAGLQTTLGFPLYSNNKPVGVVEFFDTDVRPPDQDILDTMKALGQQIGMFIERIQAVESRDRITARQAAVLDSAMDCIVSMDEMGNVTHWNPEAVVAFGYKPEEAIGRTVADLMIPAKMRQSHREGLSLLGRHRHACCPTPFRSSPTPLHSSQTICRR